MKITSRRISCLVAAVLLISLACSIPGRLLPELTPSLANSATPTAATTLELVPTPDESSDSPQGKIVFSCQISGIQYRDQICVINPDGTGFNPLTPEENSEHFYPSLAPDGKSVVYSANPTGIYEIYESDLLGNARQLTHGLGTLTAPEISPDGTLIAFTLGNGDATSVWIVDRNGLNPRVVYGPGWDPTWSPDGKKLLFASFATDKSIQLFIINLDGSDLQQVTRMENLRGRSDWSPDGKWVVTYTGTRWNRELYLIPMESGEPVQLSPSGGNSQGPSFSPDGKWVAFTAYFNAIGNEDGCEIYIIRTDGTRLTRLTNNSYCDWQPRWGP